MIARVPPHHWPASLPGFRVALVALAAGLAFASLRTTIAGRGRDPFVEFIVVGPPIGETLYVVVATALAVLLGYGWLQRARPHSWPTNLLLLACVCPIVGISAAMWGGAFAPLLVYWCWELAPWWMATAAALAIADAARTLPPAPSAGPVRGRWAKTQFVMLGCAVVAWIVAANPALRNWRGPLGDEPRYLRFLESWSQGNGTDISHVAKLSEMPRDVPPRLLEAAGLAARTLIADVTGFAADVKGSLTQRGYTWNRNTAGDGSFITGRGGGIFQSHQPGLPLVLLPGYAIDRYWFSTGTVYDGQFPDRLPLLHATLLLIAALGAAAVALLCLHAGLDRAWAFGFGFLSWASFPASAMALQIYPETCAGLAIAGTLALLAGPRKFAAGGAAAIGFAAGFPWLLHLRFVLGATALLVYGLWALRRTQRRAVAFALGWALPVAAQLWYVYHATGVPWPSAFYLSAAEGLVRGAAVPMNALRFVFDRDWGVLAHTPLLMLAVAGFAPLWRARRDLAIVVAAIAILLLGTASTHSVVAGGGTPDRLITAFIPLLFLPVAAAVYAWRTRPIMLVIFTVLVVLTLDQAWDYSRSHLKGAGLFVSPGAGGWRVNLLFPFTGEGWTRNAWWALIGVAVPLVLLTAAFAGRPREGAGAGAVGALPAGILFVLIVGVATTLAEAWTASQPRYRHTAVQARSALVAAYVRAGTCRLCWSSHAGPVAAQAMGPNRVESVVLDVDMSDSTLVRLRLTATGPDGPVYGTTRFEFGDGEVGPARVMTGAADVAHVYRTGGLYNVKGWLFPAGGTPHVATATVRIPGPSAPRPLP